MSWLQPIAVLVCWTILYCIILQFVRRHRPAEDVRLSFLKASVLLGLFVYLITEGLSLFDRLTFNWVLSAWLFTALVLLLFVPKSVKEPLSRLRSFLRWCIHEYPVYTFMAFLILILNGIVALNAPPNTWDSMAYHLPRVMHWESRQNIDFYPSHILRQLYMGPGAEIAILQLGILSKNDSLFCLVQFFSMIGSVLGISYIVKLWKGSPGAQWISVILALSIPMAVLQSSTTQNDLVAGFWVICFVALTLEWITKDTDADSHVFAYAGAALGFGILTKNTAGVFALPFVAWYPIIFFRRGKRVKYGILLTAAIVLLLNFSHTYRNWRQFGVFDSAHPITSPYLNDRHDPAAYASVVIRNVALHISALPFPFWYRGVENSIVHIHSILGISPSDPGLTFGQSEFLLDFHISQDLIGNLAHLCLAIFSFAFLLIRSRADSRWIRPYAWSVIAGFLLFCFLIKWQPWGSRLHLPWFLLAVPCIAIAVDQMRLKHLGLFLSLMLTIPGVYVLLKSENRPLAGPKNVLLRDRISQYFVSRPDLLEPYTHAIKAIRDAGCSQVGLILGEDSWEYPFWVLGKQMDGNITYEHVLVKNQTDSLKTVSRPCAVISTQQNTQHVEIEKTEYSRVFYQDPLSVWIRHSGL